MKQDRTLKAIDITLNNVCIQLDILDDIISDICKERAEYETYHKLFDYVWSSVVDVQEKLKTIM